MQLTKSQPAHVTVRRVFLLNGVQQIWQSFVAVAILRKSRALAG